MRRATTALRHLLFVIYLYLRSNISTWVLGKISGLFCRPGYIYWESVLFPTTFIKWAYLSQFSDWYFFIILVTKSHDKQTTCINVCYIQLVSFQTLHTQKIWENETYFHYLSERLQLLHSLCPKLPYSSQNLQIIRIIPSLIFHE